MNAKKIQLVLQGGGARMFALIAALEEIDKAVQAGQIEVTRIAGTSAGAIAGGLYAAGVKPEVMKLEFGHFDLSSAIDLPPTDGWFPRARYFRYLWSLLSKFLRGRPIANDRPLREMLVRMLATPDEPEPDLKDVDIPMLIMAADVSNREPIAYDSEGDYKTKSLVSCMLDSSAIPFFFRTVPSDQQDLVLDGGLVENLPIQSLLTRDRPEPGEHPAEKASSPEPILALSFKNRPGVTPNTTIELAASLLDTMIGASVARVKSLENLFVVDLDPAGVSLLDFERVQRILRGEEHRPYQSARDRTREVLAEIRGGRGHVVSNIRWDGVDTTTGRQLLSVYEQQQNNRKFKQTLRRLTIIANSLLQEGEEDYGSRDIVITEMEFTPTDRPVDCLMARILVDPGQKPSNVFFETRDSENREVNLTTIPVASVSKEGQEIYAIQVSFVPPLEPAAAGEEPTRYFARSEFRIEQAFPKLLEKQEADVFGSRITRASGTVDRVELVLHRPSSLGRIIGRAQDDSVSLTEKDGPIRKGQLKSSVWWADNVPDGSLVGVDLKLA